MFGRYTYLYDLATLGQLGGAEYDQKSQILSFEGVYKLDQHWEFASKLARREGEVRGPRDRRVAGFGHHLRRGAGALRPAYPMACAGRIPLRLDVRDGVPNRASLWVSTAT